MFPAVRGTGAVPEATLSAMGETRAQGPRRTPDEFCSVFALLRALSALRNLIFSHPLRPSLSESLQSHLRHRPRSSHSTTYLPTSRIFSPLRADESRRLKIRAA